MLPDISNRITNIIKAIEKTISPAIDAENRMAQEQAALAIGHLQMLEQQWNYAYVFEKGSFENMLALANQLYDVAGGGQAITNAKNALLIIIKGLPEVLPLTPVELNEHTPDYYIESKFNGDFPEHYMWYHGKLLTYDSLVRTIDLPILK